MEPGDNPLIPVIIILGIITFFAVFGIEAFKGCLPSDDDVQREIRDDHRRMSTRAIRDGGTATSDAGTTTIPDGFTGRLYVRPEFQYSDRVPDAADDFDLRRDAGAPRSVDN